ncbi:aminotransferase-like domain-containing protein [Vibrio paucivorans]
MARYKQLADKFVEDIQQGVLAEGSQMPSLRKLAQQHSISVSTAVSCYQELESQGWIASRPQAGFYVASSRTQLASPQWSQFESKVSNPANTVYTGTSYTGPLGVSNSTIDSLALSELEKSTRRVVKRMGARLSHYPSHQGEPALRQALSEHFTQLGFGFQSDALVVTHGCISAVKAALEACTQPGDAVAISSPCFNGLIELLAQMGRKIVEIPSAKDGIDLQQLEMHLEHGTIQAGLFCTSHMNPQGISMTVEQKTKLASLANQYKTPIIEDDVYIELSHSNHFPLPAKYYDKGGYIIWCGSVSKTLSAGYRLGWCLPGRYMQAYRDKFASGCFGVSTPIQLIVADFIATGQYAKYLRRKRFDLLNFRRSYMDFLQQHLPAKARISSPQGGLVLWIQIQGLKTDAFAHDIEQKQIDIRLGQLFTSLPLYRDCLRINTGHDLTDEIKSELRTLTQLIHQHS